MILLLNFRLRGLCSDSLLDRIYRLVPDVEVGRKYFIGISGWKLEREGASNQWRISNERYPGKHLDLINCFLLKAQHIQEYQRLCQLRGIQ